MLNVPRKLIHIAHSSKSQLRPGKRRVPSFFMILLIILVSGCQQKDHTPHDIIFDTDISSDVDDVGAVAVLHALADNREVNILAMAVSSGDRWSAPCLQALNGWFGRPEIPVGAVLGKSVMHKSLYTKTIAMEYGKGGGNAPPVIDAVHLYRQILSSRPDKSVTIITVGYLTNLANLMSSQADALSPLDGPALIRQKVKRVVCMGGEFPTGREWNFYQDANATKTVIKQWPTPMVFSGFEIGHDVMTGTGLQKMPVDNPVRRSYELYNGVQNRSSWDQLAVMYAARWSDDEMTDFLKLRNGKVVVLPDGSNDWLDVDNPAPRAYLQRTASADTLAREIESLMVKK